MMDQATAQRVVFRAAARLNLDYSNTDFSLADIGLVSVEERAAFKNLIHSEVFKEGFRISVTAMALELNSTLGEIIDIVQFFSLPGSPTKGDDDV
jgi:hypothetical protein